MGVIIMDDFDEITEPTTPNRRGKGIGQRHFVKRARWEVLSAPTDGFMKGTWLIASEAKKMLQSGTFYENGTCLMLYPENIKVWVKGKKIYVKPNYRKLHRFT